MAKKYKNTVHKNPFREDRPQKPFPWKAFTVVALFIVIAILVSVLVFEMFFGPIKLKNTSGTNVYDGRNKIVYAYAPFCYQPVTILKSEVYAKYNDGTVTRNLYKIKNVDPTVMITTAEDGLYDIYYNSANPLPTLKEFEVVGAEICEVELLAGSIGWLQKEDAERAVQLVCDGESGEYPSNVDSESVRYLYFRSQKYEYMYYYITYLETKDGERYLVDRSFGRYVNIGDELSDVLYYEPSKS